MSDGTGSSSYSYDSLHRLVQSVNGNNKTVGYAYNLRGLLTTLTYPGNTTVTRGYDSAGRLTSVADWLNHTTTFAYDADSNLTTETYANGILGTFAFDAADRMSSTVDSLSGTQFLSLTYHRDADGQLTQGSATQQYGYDTTNRVNSWTNSGASTTYGYDAADEITGITGSASTTMGYDVAGQVGTFVTTSGGNTTQNLSYSYDAQGNRTQVSDNLAHTSTTFGYDQANRLKSYGSSASYQYDGNGLRASKVVSGTTTNYAWDISGSLPLMILANNTDWIYGPGGVVLEEIVPTNTVYYYHQDQLGSTRKVTDSTGTVVRSYTFDPWGNVSSTSGTLSTPFQFAGEYTDMESGLFYLRARYYDPVTGQLTSLDPALAITRAPYVYVGDSPLDATDPTGQSAGCAGNVCETSLQKSWRPTSPDEINAAVTAAGVVLDVCSAATVETIILSLACGGLSVACNGIGLAIDFSEGNPGNVGLDLLGMVPAVGATADEAKLIKLGARTKKLVNIWGAASDGVSVGRLTYGNGPAMPPQGLPPLGWHAGRNV